MGRPKLGQPRAVGAAANDGAIRRSAKPLRRLFGIGHGARLADKALGHVAILPLDGHVDLRRRKVPHRRRGRLPQPVGKLLEHGRVEIAEQDFQFHFRDAAGDFVGMQEALAAVGRFRREAFRGNRAMKSAAARTALVIRPLAIDGWMFTPRTVTTA